MRVEPLTADHVMSIRLQPAQAEWERYRTPDLAAALEAEGGAWAVVTDRVLAIAGVQDRGEGRVFAWSLLAADCGRQMVFLTRAIRRFLDDAPYRRIEIATACNFAPATRWATMLGFRSEGLMTAYFGDGSDAERWARINVRV